MSTVPANLEIEGKEIQDQPEKQSNYKPHKVWTGVFIYLFFNVTSLL